MTTEERAILLFRALPLEQQQKALNYLEGLQAEARLQPMQMTRQEIDAALLEMASDPEYQAEALQIEAEFAAAQYEVWSAVEADK